LCMVKAADSRGVSTIRTQTHWSSNDAIQRPPMRLARVPVATASPMPQVADEKAKRDIQRAVETDGAQLGAPSSN
jgi:hypothetical protein